MDPSAVTIITTMSDEPVSIHERRTHFERIYNETSHRILGYALRRTSSPEDAADVVAETFATGWRRLDEVPDGDEARLWLYGVARRVLANQRRGQLRQQQLAVRLRSALPRLVEEAMLEPPSDLAAITAAIAQLRHDDREILTLVAWEGLDRDQVATVLGCSRAGVRVRLHRARRRFARLLDAADADEPGQGRPAVLPMGAAWSPTTYAHQLQREEAP
jgi:RNA polymerase sigma factor (sigma-70 family)